MPDEICNSKDFKYSISCVETTLCKPLQDVLRLALNTSLDKSVTTLLKSYTCGFDGGKPKVWCQQQSINEIEPPNVENHKNVMFLPQNCGVVNTVEENPNRNKTGVFEFPWMALLSYATSVLFNKQ